jgi:toxin HigB-1
MIVSFRHKGLERFWRLGNAGGIPWELAKRVKVRLDALYAAELVADLRVPSFKLHQLHRDQAGRWAIWVNGPWRITFAFDEQRGEASGVDLEQYH